MSGVAGALALVLAFALVVGIIIGFTVQGIQINGTATVVVQSGNFTWDLYTGTAVVDAVVLDYTLRQQGASYMLELATLPRPLFVPAELAPWQATLEVRMHAFAPEVVPLAALGLWEYLVPLARHNMEAIVIKGAQPCLLVGWPGKREARSSVAFVLEPPGAAGYVQLIMQSTDGGPQDWSNYTFVTVRPLRLTLISA